MKKSIIIVLFFLLYQIAIQSSNIQENNATLETSKDISKPFVQMGHTDIIKSIDVSKDGKYMVSGGQDSLIKLWDIEKKRNIKTFKALHYVKKVSFSPNGRYIISVSSNIQIWNVETGKEIIKLREQFIFLHYDIRNILFSPDDKYLSFIQKNETIALWSTENWKKIREFKIKNIPIKTLTFSQDKKYLLGVCLNYFDKEKKKVQKGILRIWDIESGDKVKDIKIDINRNRCDSLSFSLNKKYLIGYIDSFGKNKKGILQIWNIENGKKVKEVKIDEKNIRINSLVSSTNKYLIIKSDNKTIKLWDLKNWKLMKIFKEDRHISSVQFSPNEKYIALLRSDNSIKLWDIVSGNIQTFKENSKQIGFLTRDSGRVGSLLFTPDGNYIISGSWNNSLKIWDINKKKSIATFQGNRINQTKVTDKYIISHFVKDLILKDIKTGKEIQRMKGHKHSIYGIGVSPNKKYIVSFDFEGFGKSGELTNVTLKLWDIERGEEIKSFQNYYFGQENPFTFDGKYLITRKVKESNRPIFFDIEREREVELFDIKNIIPLAFSLNNKYFAIADKDKKITLWDIKTKKKVKIFSGYSNNIESIRLSLDSKYMIILLKVKSKYYSSKKIIEIWDIGSGKNIQTIFLQKKDSTQISAISSNSEYFISTNSFYDIKLWDIKSGKQIKVFKGHNDTILYTEFINDNKQILSASWDGTIKIWDIKTGKELVTMVSFDDGEWITITPDGFFNSSTNGAKYLNIRFNGLEVTDIGRFYDHFFRPDLIKLKLAGEEEAYRKAIGNLDFKEALNNPPPTVKIEETAKETSKDKIKLAFNVEEQKGGVGLIRIYQEGKLIVTIGEGEVKRQSANIDAILAQDRRDAIQRKEQEKKKKVNDKNTSKNISEVKFSVPKVTTPTTTNKAGEYRVEIDLKSGNNEIAIEAFNKTNTVASYRESVTIDAKIPKRKPKLYVIVAGVNEFESTAEGIKNLSYSENDANAIKKAVEEKMKTVFNGVEVTPLIGQELTKANLYKTAKEISLKAHLEDTVLFYISTHGRSMGGKLYLVPYNNANGEDWLDFEQTFKAIQSIKALNQIFVIDACESGTANDIVSAVYDSKASVLAKSSGVHMLLATTRGTNAFESDDPKVKNGVFTHRILEALRSRGTDLNQDNFISIKEVSTELRKPQSNSEFQYPVIRNVGSDVVLERVE